MSDIVGDKVKVQNKQTNKKERIHGFSSQSLKDHQEKEERYS